MAPGESIMRMQTDVTINTAGPALEGLSPSTFKKGVALQNRLPIRLLDGDSIKPGTGFVCERGGKTVKLVYWRNQTNQYECLKMPKADCQRYFIDTSPGTLPISLALHFGLSLREYEAPPIQPGFYYLLLADITLPNFSVAMKGDLVKCDSTFDSLCYFSFCDRDPNDMFILPPADHVLLRFVAADSATSFIPSTGSDSAWLH
jgi:hypothetical protein